MHQRGIHQRWKECCALWFQGAHGVVASHPLRMRKALGSNPSVSICARVMSASRASFTNKEAIALLGGTAGGCPFSGSRKSRKNPQCGGGSFTVWSNITTACDAGPTEPSCRPPCSPAHALPHAHETSHTDAQPIARPCGATQRMSGNNISFR